MTIILKTINSREYYALKAVMETCQMLEDCSSQNHLPPNSLPPQHTYQNRNLPSYCRARVRSTVAWLPASLLPEWTTITVPSPKMRQAVVLAQ